MKSENKYLAFLLLMRILRIAIVSSIMFFAFLSLMDDAEAASFIGTSATGVDVPCYIQDVSETALETASGSVAVCFYYDGVAHSNSTTTITAIISTPVLTGAGSSTAMNLTTGPTCSISDEVTVSTSPTSPEGSMRSSRWNITMSGDDCRGYLRATVTAGAGGTVITDLFLPLVVVPKDTVINTDTTSRSCGPGEFGQPCLAHPFLFATLAFAIYLGMVVWAERTKLALMFIASAITGIFITFAFTSEIPIMRIPLSATIIFCLLSAIHFREVKEE